jgi:hypothetical protein
VGLSYDSAEKLHFLSSPQNGADRLDVKMRIVIFKKVPKIISGSKGIS